MDNKEIIKLDIENLRPKRQEINNELVRDMLIKNNISRDELETVCNKNELDRMLKDISKQLGKEFSFRDFHNECKNNALYLYSVAPRIAINSSRQSSIDESTVLTVCNKTTSKYGVNIEKLPNDYIRAHRHSCKLIYKDEYKKGKGEYKQNDCLKSFDAKISGKKDGYIFAKVCIGCGGHQDNVFDEAYHFGEWADKYGEENKLYIILIDTNIINKFYELKEKYKNNSKVYVVDHIDLQKLLIN